MAMVKPFKYLLKVISTFLLWKGSTLNYIIKQLAAFCKFQNNEIDQSRLLIWSDIHLTTFIEHHQNIYMIQVLQGSYLFHNHLNVQIFNILMEDLDGNLLAGLQIDG